MLRAVFPHVRAVGESTRVLACTHGLDEKGPGIAVVRPANQHSPAGDRIGRVGAQRPPELGQPEPLAWLLVENAERGNSAQETVKRARVGLSRRSELIARARLVAHQIRKAERRRGVDHLRSSEAIKEAPELGSSRTRRLLSKL